MHNDESEALKETLRITTRLIEAAAPPETYWPRYHAKLRTKLRESREPRVAAKKPSWFTRFFASSVSIPAPVAAALAVAIGLTIFVALRAV